MRNMLKPANVTVGRWHSYLRFKRRSDPGADTSELEQEIDRHVYALYGLTPEEIKIESRVRK